MNKILYRLFVIGLMVLAKLAIAETQTMNLYVAYKTVTFAGKSRQAIAINDQIPGPTLHFKEGDEVTINVYNQLNQSTSIHWHGILVPWQMDGVDGISQKPIPPGGFFHYHFTLHQSGTYWYHAHVGLQEQEGLYGAFLIDPINPTPYYYDKDYTVVLSDWSNIPAEGVLANLKKDGDYYSPRFPLQPSLMKFIHDYQKSNTEEREALWNDYSMMQQMRMSIYDLSDVAYDAYLLNGQSKEHPWTALVKKGDMVRLRFIGAAGSTIYNIKIPETALKIVHIDGNDVAPFSVKSFSLAPGETYDALVSIKTNQPLIIYAESIDTLGKAYGALVTTPHQAVDYASVKPFPEPLPVTREMMKNMMASQGDMKMSDDGAHSMKGSTHKANMDMSGMGMDNMPEMTSTTASPDSMNMDMTMPTEPAITGDTQVPPNSELLSLQTIGTKYQSVTAAVPTNDPKKPVNEIIRMELFGYMGRYIWFINGLPEYKVDPIAIKPNQRYRIIFTNNSMMRHPMHIHGHWFILRNGHEAYDPLLHTVVVPPGATAVVDVDSDASGQWFFHCHHAYHMIAGMSRVFQYNTIIEVEQGKEKPEKIVTSGQYINRPIVREDEVMPIDATLLNDPMPHPMGLYQASFLDLGEDPFNNDQEMTFKGLYGSDYNKLELYTNEAEIDQGTIDDADIDIFYWHLLNQFWAIKGGANYFYRPSENPYWQPGLGIEGLMPYFIDTNLRLYYHEDSVKLDAELSRDSQITNNIFIRAGIRSIIASQTVVQDDIGNGLNQLRYTLRPYYRLMPGVNLFAQWEYDQNFGEFNNLCTSDGECTSGSVVTFGISTIF